MSADMPTDISKRLQADAIFFGTRQEPLLVDDAVCREMAECWEIAADEIERLRKEHDEAEPLLDELWDRRTEATELRSEIERLRKERDEARREVCKGEAMLRLQRNRVHRDSEEVVRMAKEISVERGWDCFDNYTEEEVTDDGGSEF